MKGKNIFIAIFFILLALVLGGLIAQVTADVPWLNWLTYEKSIGVSTETPMVIDLSLVKLTFGAEFKINVVQVLLLIAAFFGYKKWFK